MRRSQADIKPTAEVITRTFSGKFTAKFSVNGGTLVSWQLTDARCSKDETNGELLPGTLDHGAFLFCAPPTADLAVVAVEVREVG